VRQWVAVNTERFAEDTNVKDFVERQAGVQLKEFKARVIFCGYKCDRVSVRMDAALYACRSLLAFPVQLCLFAAQESRQRPRLSGLSRLDQLKLDFNDVSCRDRTAASCIASTVLNRRPRLAPNSKATAKARFLSRPSRTDPCAATPLATRARTTARKGRTRVASRARSATLEAATKTAL
jgi:hypothetical protein